MNRRFLLSLLCVGTVFLATPSAHADDWFDFQAVMRTLKKFFFPPPVHYNYDPHMIKAAEIAVKRAHPKMTWHCWGAVKDALLQADVITKRPKSPWAKQAGAELCENYGFIKVPIRNPYDAPVGSVIVYGGLDAGHVELRSSTGFVSDFTSQTPYPRPLIGVYLKPI
ncbi:MAG: hypothetical protein WCD79_19645 [Chthoniobacteraceae bacterium]